MKKLFGGLAMAAGAVAVVCLVANGALAANPERPYRGWSEEMVVGPCELGGVVGELLEGMGNATHAGRTASLTCVIVTGGAFPVYTVAGRGVSTRANGDQSYYFLEGTVNVLEDPCVGEFTLNLVGGISRKGAPLNITGEIQGTQLRPWSAPGVCGPEGMSTLSGTITY